MEKEKLADIRKILYQIDQATVDISYLEDLISEDREEFKLECWHDNWFYFTKDDFRAMIEIRNKKIDEYTKDLKEALED